MFVSYHVRNFLREWRDSFFSFICLADMVNHIRFDWIFHTMQFPWLMGICCLCALHRLGNIHYVFLYPILQLTLTPRSCLMEHGWLDGGGGWIRFPEVGWKRGD